MLRARRTLLSVALGVALIAGACGDGSSGGAEGEEKPGEKTEDTGTGY